MKTFNLKILLSTSSDISGYCKQFYNIQIMADDISLHDDIIEFYNKIKLEKDSVKKETVAIYPKNCTISRYF